MSIIFKNYNNFEVSYFFEIRIHIPAQNIDKSIDLRIESNR